MVARIAGMVAALALGLTSVGCYVEPMPVAYADSSAEVDVQTAPRASYEGRDVYYTRDHWYYRDGARWAYYRQEPAELHRQRTYVRPAPPARPYR